MWLKFRKAFLVVMMMVFFQGLDAIRIDTLNVESKKNFFDTQPLNVEKVRTVVIDPGHGGKDPGCHGVFSKEKEVALAIALSLGRKIERHYPDVRVVYTRKTDVFVELHQRARIANESNGDLFICIHCNAGPADAHGSETYALGLHRAATNLAVAKRENEAILLEDNYKENYMGFDINSPEGSVVFSLIQNTFLNRSLQFAEKCQKYFKNMAGRYDRGVKQAGFLVLVYTAMPAVLIETGFLTNKQEEGFLADKRNQETMAEAIFRALVEYKCDIENVPVPRFLQENEDKTSVPQRQPISTFEKVEYPVISSDTSFASTSEKVLPDEFLTVQFAAFPGKRNDLPVQFKALSEVFFLYESGMSRFFSGKFFSMEEAEVRKKQLILHGYRDAFITGISEGKRVNPNIIASKILQKN